MGRFTSTSMGPSPITWYATRPPAAVLAKRVSGRSAAPEAHHRPTNHATPEAAPHCQWTTFEEMNPAPPVTTIRVPAMRQTLTFTGCCARSRSTRTRSGRWGRTTSGSRRRATRSASARARPGTPCSGSGSPRTRSTRCSRRCGPCCASAGGPRRSGRSGARPRRRASSTCCSSAGSSGTATRSRSRSC